MTESSVDRRAPRRDSTRSIRAGLFVADEVAAFFMMDRGIARECLMHEPLKRVVGVIEWLQKHESDPDFDPALMLVRWARKRGAGPFRELPECAGCHEHFLGRELYEVGDGNLTFFEGELLCEGCAQAHGVR